MEALPEDHILEEVSPDQQLVQEMKKFLPHSHQLVSMVQLHLRYQHFPLLRARVFTPRCALFRYKMVVITRIATANDLSSMSLFWSEDHLSDDAVLQLLKSLPEFNWKGNILIRQLPIHLHQNLDHMIRELSECSLVAELVLPIEILSVVNSTHEIPSLPEGYYAGPLRKVHGQQVLTGWVGRFGENLEDFSLILDQLPAVGIFKTRKLSPESSQKTGTTPGVESGDQTYCSSESIAGRTSGTGSEAQPFSELGSTTADTAEERAMSFTASKTNDVRVHNLTEANESQDELVGWCVLKQGADIGMTYTTKGHRKLGLAKVATLSLVRQIQEKQLHAFILVTEDNAISIDMHKKLGFEEYTTDIILMYCPEQSNGDDGSEVRS